RVRNEYNNPWLGRSVYLGEVYLERHSRILFLYCFTLPGIWNPNEGGAIEQLICCHSQRSEEHTSELQSRSDLVCRLLLEKKHLYHRHVRDCFHTLAHKPLSDPPSECVSEGFARCSTGMVSRSRAGWPLPRDQSLPRHFDP